MAKKKKEVELKEVSRTEVNGTIIIKYEDGSIKIIPAPIALTAEEAEDGIRDRLRSRGLVDVYKRQP